MRPLHSLLVVLAVALALSAAWFLIGTSKPRIDAASAAPAPAESGSTGAATASELQTPLAAEQTGARLERAEEQPAANAARSAAAQTGEGTLVVTGRVVDSGGAPVEGARVLASGGGAGLPVFGGIPLDVRGGAELGWLKRTETTTGSDGRFELAGLRPGGLRLAVRRSGFAPFDEDGRSLPAGARFDLGEIRLETGVSIAGRVVDARGQAVEGAQVLRLSSPTSAASLGHFASGFGSPVAETGPDGSFVVDQLGAGPWALRVESEVHPHAQVSGETARAGERVDGLVVQLEEGEEIHGLVRGSPQGQALMVRAMPRGRAAESASEEEGIPAFSGEVRRTDVASDGTFRVRGLRRGLSYEVGLTRADRGGGPGGFLWAPSLATPVRAQAGARDVVLDYQPESALVFQVLDKRTSQPVEEFTVDAGIDWPVPQMGEDGRRVRQRPEGRARVGNLRPRATADRAQLRIAAVGYSPFESDDLPLAVGQDTDLGPIFLEPLPLLTVRVLDGASGEPVSGASVVLSEIDPQQDTRYGQRIELDVQADGPDDFGDVHIGGDTSQRARTDERGVALLTLPAGASCRLTVRSGKHAPWRSEVFPSPRQAAEREVRLGPGGSVLARVIGPEGEPVAGGRVEHQAPSADGGFAELGFGGHHEVTDERGEVRFEHLEPGLHRFRLAKDGGEGFLSGHGGAYAIRVGGVEGGGRGWVEALVSEGAASEIEIVAPLEVVLEGRVREGGEPLGGATVELALRDESDDPRPRMPFLGGGGPSAQTDSGGRYRLEGVEPGEYTLTVRHPTRSMPSEEIVVVRETDLRHDVDLSVAIVEGEVHDAAGKPLAGVRVWPVRAEPQGARQVVRVMAFASADGDSSMVTFDEGGFASVQARTDAQGRYQLRGVAPDVELQVRAEGKGLQPARSAAFRVGRDDVRRNVDLALETAGSIEVTAQRSDGSPARNLLVTARLEAPAGAESAEARNEFLGEEGRALIDGLAPGTWSLSARVLGPGDGDAPEDQIVQVVAGEMASALFTLP